MDSQQLQIALDAIYDYVEEYMKNHWAMTMDEYAAKLKWTKTFKWNDPQLQHAERFLDLLHKDITGKVFAQAVSWDDLRILYIAFIVSYYPVLPVSQNMCKSSRKMLPYANSTHSFNSEAVVY